jgi:hypothetical protein
MLLIAACVRRQPREWPVSHAATPDDVRQVQPTGDTGLYSAQAALRDVLSGELEYVGTGSWPGVERLRACAFRNQRVVVVNTYCSLYEQPAFRMEVYSPERGRVRIYAETQGTVSARQRRDYFTFMVESSPPPSAAARLPVLSLQVPYEELRRYEQQRYEAFLPGCFAGEQNRGWTSGCLGALSVRESEWAADNRAFLENANADWYLVVQKLRTLAARYGVHPVH